MNDDEETLSVLACALSLGLGMAAIGFAAGFHDVPPVPVFRMHHPLWHRLVMRERELIRRIRWVRPKDY